MPRALARLRSCALVGPPLRERLRAALRPRAVLRVAFLPPMARLDSRRPRPPVIALLALSAIFAYQRWEEWLTAAIGVWVFISLWVLGAVSNARILWSSLVVGALLVILALWSSSLEHGSGAIVTRR